MNEDNSIPSLIPACRYTPGVYRHMVSLTLYRHAALCGVIRYNCMKHSITHIFIIYNYIVVTEWGLRVHEVDPVTNELDHFDFEG